MKVVYNNCYGGFGLSKEAKKRYAELKGDPDYFKRFSPHDLDRADPILVQVVEEGKASGCLASLSIDDVPSGSKWRIDEYDGNESVMLISDYEWQTAI